MVKPALWWKWFSKNLGVSCVPPSVCCLLHDHSASWTRGWTHFVNKHNRNTSQVYWKDEVLMHPDSKSWTETGSRQQKNFLNKSSELFATGNVDKSTGAGCQSRYPSCLFWVTGPHHLPRTASAGAAEGAWFWWNKLIFLKSILAIVWFCSIVPPWSVLFSHTERSAWIVKLTWIWSKHYLMIV